MSYHPRLFQKIYGSLMGAVMRPHRKIEDALQVLTYDPYKLQERQLFSRVCLRYTDRALTIARKSRSPRQLIEKCTNQLTRTILANPAEMLAVLLGILLFTEAIPLAVNYGRDNDSIAGIVGAMAGALYGIDSFPDEWICTVHEANPQPAIEALATSLEEILTTG